MSEAGDAIYIGSDRRFTGIYLELATGGNYTGLKYEYIRREGELAYVPLIDSYGFDISKYCRWNLPENWACLQLTNGFPYPIDPPDTVERFWIKLSAAAVTGMAVISKIRLMPYASYTTPAKVAEFLQLKKNYFEYNSTTRFSLNVIGISALFGTSRKIPLIFALSRLSQGSCFPSFMPPAKSKMSVFRLDPRGSS